MLNTMATDTKHINSAEVSDNVEIIYDFIFFNFIWYEFVFYEFCLVGDLMIMDDGDSFDFFLSQRKKLSHRSIKFVF